MRGSLGLAMIPGKNAANLTGSSAIISSIKAHLVTYKGTPATYNGRAANYQIRRTQK